MILDNIKTKSNKTEALDSISTKLRRLRTLRGKTQTEIATDLGITQATWSALERGQRKPSFDLLKRIVLKFAVSADWLLTESEGGAGNGHSTQVEEWNTGKRGIPVIGHITAGTLVERYASDQAEEFVSLHTGDDRPGEALFGVRVTGPSMEPWMYEGDVAICSAVQEVQEGQDVFVYRFESGESTIKRLERWDRETGLIELSALNPTHASLSFRLRSKDQIKKVVSVWRDVSTGRKREKFD